MKGVWAAAGIVVATSLLASCSGHRGPSGPGGTTAADAGEAAADTGDARPPIGVVGVHQVFAPFSPVFLVAGDGTGKAVAFLAKKDQQDNPYAVTGAAFFDGDRFISFEVDDLGRPARFVTPTSVVELSDYSATTVTLRTFHAGAEVASELITFTPDELEALKVEVPSLAPAQKSTGGPAEQLVHFGHLLSELYGCANGLRHSFPAHNKLFDGILTVVETSIECGGFGAQLSTNFSDTLDIIKAITATFGCATDVAAVGTVSLTGLGAVALAALGLAQGARIGVDCAAAVEDIIKVYQNHIRANLLDGFSPRVDGNLIVGKKCDITVWVYPQPDDIKLRVISVNLTEIGGTAERLARDGVWQWRGQVTPQVPGERIVRFSVIPDPQRPPFEMSITTFVQDTDALQVSLQISRTVVKAGDTVTVTAVPTGGVPPYEYWWNVVRDPVELVDISRTQTDFPLRIDRRTRFGLELYDSTSQFRKHASAGPPIWVEVCGDNYCGAGEKEAGCEPACAMPEPGNDGGTTEDAGTDVGIDAPDPFDAGASDDAAEPPMPRTNVNCGEACAYRAETMGCAGDPAICAVFCQAIHTVASQEGICAELALALEDCHYSRAALDLGCVATRAMIDATVCAANSRAYDACKTFRDRPNPDPNGTLDAAAPADAEQTPEARCAAACAYRSQVLGCAGDPGNCAVGCVAGQSAARQQGVCAGPAVALEDCRYSTAALNLGCTAFGSQIDEQVCPAESAALDRCVAVRDCPAGSICP